MNSNEILISKGNLNCDVLEGKVAIVTGAGGGIGYEAARAHVIIAEIDDSIGRIAAQKINAEMKREAASFFQTDVGNEDSPSYKEPGVLNPRLIQTI